MTTSTRWVVFCFKALTGKRWEKDVELDLPLDAHLERQLRAMLSESLFERPTTLLELREFAGKSFRGQLNGNRISHLFTPIILGAGNDYNSYSGPYRQTFRIRPYPCKGFYLPVSVFSFLPHYCLLFYPQTHRPNPYQQQIVPRGLQQGDPPQRPRQRLLLPHWNPRGLRCSRNRAKSSRAIS